MKQSGAPSEEVLVVQLGVHVVVNGEVLLGMGLVAGHSLDLQDFSHIKRIGFTLELYHLEQPSFIVGDCKSGGLLGLLGLGGPHLLDDVGGGQLLDGIVLLAVDDVAAPDKPSRF